MDDINENSKVRNVGISLSNNIAFYTYAQVTNYLQLK